MLQLSLHRIIHITVLIISIRITPKKPQQSAEPSCSIYFVCLSQPWADPWGKLPRITPVQPQIFPKGKLRQGLMSVSKKRPSLQTWHHYPSPRTPERELQHFSLPKHHLGKNQSAATSAGWEKKAQNPQKKGLVGLNLSVLGGREGETGLVQMERCSSTASPELRDEITPRKQQKNQSKWKEMVFPARGMTCPSSHGKKHGKKVAKSCWIEKLRVGVAPGGDTQELAIPQHSHSSSTCPSKPFLGGKRENLGTPDPRGARHSPAFPPWPVPLLAFSKAPFSTTINRQK